MNTQVQVCTRTFALEKPWTLQAYESIGGYQAWRKIVKQKTPPADIVDIVKKSGLKGRGGAGFLTGLKWSFIPKDYKGQRYLICNSDEGEPGTCKDTEILLLNPHQLLEGILISSYAMGATVAYHYLRGEFLTQFERCESALAEARKAGLIGKKVLKSDIDIDCHNVLGAGSYIVGEETAMIESLEGKRAMPRVKPPFPAIYGLYGKPTTVNNTETLASVPIIMEKGPEWFAEQGCKNSGGTKLFCVSGHVNSPGVFELPLGTPFAKLIELAGGMRQGRKCKAVIPGGSSMRVLPGAVIMQTNLDYDSVFQAGSMLGSGGVIVMDDTTCMVDAMACILRFYHDESCGQCTPCREGSGWVLRIVERILAGNGIKEDVDKLYTVAKNIEGRTICAFGEAISWPVTSFVEHFYDEFAYFVKHKRSMITSQKKQVSNR